MSRSKAFIPLIAFVQAAAFGGHAWAAACCGGTSSSPSLISSDDRLQFSASFSNGSIIGDAPTRGLPVFRSSQSGDTTSSVRFSVASLISDRIQVGLDWSAVSREVWRGANSARFSGVGDPTLSLAYESWPEWEYSEWKPRGYWFGQVTLPFANSIYNSDRTDLLDAVGTGMMRISTGVLLLKARGNWDFSLLSEIHRSIPRTFEPSGAGGAVRVDGGIGSSVLLSSGYNWPHSAWRLGFRVQPVWNSSRDVTLDGTTARSDQQWVGNTGADISYLLNDEISLTTSYTDQTLLGPASNTTLSRVAAFQILKHWPR